MRTIIEPFRIKSTEPIRLPAYRITWQPEFLRHFTCHFLPCDTTP